MSFKIGDIVIVIRSISSMGDTQEGTYGDYYIGEIGEVVDANNDVEIVEVDFPPTPKSKHREGYTVHVSEITLATKLARLLSGIDNETA